MLGEIMRGRRTHPIVFADPDECGRCSLRQYLLHPEQQLIGRKLP